MDTPPRRLFLTDGSGAPTGRSFLPAHGVRWPGAKPREALYRTAGYIYVLATWDGDGEYMPGTRYVTVDVAGAARWLAANGHQGVAAKMRNPTGPGRRRKAGGRMTLTLGPIQDLVDAHRVQGGFGSFTDALIDLAQRGATTTEGLYPHPRRPSP